MMIFRKLHVSARYSALARHRLMSTIPPSRYPQKGDKVYVAMSGGVDSSVTAKLLADQDYDLSAIFMRNWDTRDESGSDRGCEWEKDWEDVQRVCRVLDIPHEMVDLSKEYWNRVFEPSLHFWEDGRTPNPDVWCNREVKFGALMDNLTFHDSWLATGHYARKSWSASGPELLRARDRNKDQTYYLSQIPESSLARTLFPLGELTKPEVRELASKHGLPTASREESMGICFVGEKRRFNDFLSRYITPRPGRIVHMETGKPIGTHNGLWNYTIGQGAKLPGHSQPLFVASKDTNNNELLVVPGSDHPALYVSRIQASEWKWITGTAPSTEPFSARLQFRHRMADVPCTVRVAAHSLDTQDTIVIITPHNPQKAVASGQIAALWDGERCLGSGIITQTN